MTDILKVLEKPGARPRTGIQHGHVSGLRGNIARSATGHDSGSVVTNVVAFGAFVDIGVHQDGLVHISALTENMCWIRTMW